jgi:hypothetical protein
MHSSQPDHETDSELQLNSLRGRLVPIGVGGSLSPGSILPLRGTGDAAEGIFSTLAIFAILRASNRPQENKASAPFPPAARRVPGDRLAQRQWTAIVGGPEGWRVARHQGGPALSQAV